MILENVQGSGVCSGFDIVRKQGGFCSILGFFTSLTLKMRGTR